MTPLAPKGRLADLALAANAILGQRVRHYEGCGAALDELLSGAEEHRCGVLGACEVTPLRDGERAHDRG